MAWLPSFSVRLHPGLLVSVLTLLLSDLCSRFQQPRLLPDRHRLGVGDRHRHVLGVCGVLRALEDCEEGIVAALGVCTADEGGLDGGVERKGLGVIDDPLDGPY